MPINIRKLAALDMAFLGSQVIVAEYVFGVFGPLALGILSLVRQRAPWQRALGVYLILLGIDYVPLLIYSVVIFRKKSAREEVADELVHREKIGSRYFPQTFLLLIPLVVPFLAVFQELRRTDAAPVA